MEKVSIDSVQFYFYFLLGWKVPTCFGLTLESHVFLQQLLHRSQREACTPHTHFLSSRNFSFREAGTDETQHFSQTFLLGDYLDGLKSPTRIFHCHSQPARP